MKIECTLSASSLAKAAKQLEKYADSLASKTEKLVQSLGEYGVERALDNYITEPLHVDTGNTVNSIQYTHEGTSGTVSAGGAAVWIEFGTGVKRNSGSGHPKKDDLGMSNWGEYGEGHGSDPNGWYYPGYDGKWHRTFGIEMNPFMYETSQEMRRELLRFAKEAFNND